MDWYTKKASNPDRCKAFDNLFGTATGSEKLARALKSHEQLRSPMGLFTREVAGVDYHMYFFNALVNTKTLTVVDNDDFKASFMSHNGVTWEEPVSASVLEKVAALSKIVEGTHNYSTHTDA